MFLHLLHSHVESPLHVPHVRLRLLVTQVVILESDVRLTSGLGLVLAEHSVKVRQVQRRHLQELGVGHWGRQRPAWSSSDKVILYSPSFTTNKVVFILIIVVVALPS